MASRSRYQKIEFPLPVATFAAGSASAVDLSSIPAQLAGRIAHVSGFKMLVTVTPTLAAGTVTPEEAQRFVRSLSVKDGTGRVYFNGTLASLRLQDALERGWLNNPEGDALATTEVGEFCREFNFAPAGMADPTDFVQPGALFRGGSINFGWGAITDVDAQVTALTGSIRCYAILELHDEVILGSLVERYESAINNGQAIGGEGLYTELALCNSSSLDAIAAGDFAEVKVQADGFARDGIHVADLEKMFHGDKNVPSGLTVIHGEPRTATDDDPKMASGTALVAAPANISPIIWSQDGQLMSKLVYAAKPNLTIKWSGTQAAGYMLATRILPRTAADVGKAEALIKAALALPLREMDVRTVKGSYAGPRRAYLALKAKVG